MEDPARLGGFGSEQVLELRGTESEFDPATYKSKVRLALTPGGVRVDFIKKRASAMNIYMRRNGASGWAKIGMDTEPPYLAPPRWRSRRCRRRSEYMVRGVLHDEEIGQDSDVAGITFKG